uniref:DNA polymerase II subunit 2 n=1 Tax=Solanum tuberosum TaxID=4113 RepID=M1D2B3_SOLTU
MSGVLRNKVQRKFKMRGYSLKVEALSEVLSFLSHFPSDALDDALELLLDELHHLSLKSSILDREPVHKVVSLLLEADAAVEENPSSSSSSASALRVIDTFIVPKFRYDPVKKFFHEHTGRLPIHGDASAKATLYKDRFLLLFQRVSRDPRFSTLAFDASSSDYGSCEISPIQSLVGRVGRRWIMGVISQLEDGHFYLEDLTAAVEYKITTGFFVENTIVLAEGEMQLDGVFQVRTCGFPPLEDREKSMAFFSGLDFFGGELEKNAVNDMFVILSDVWLDNEEFGKLGQMIASHQRLKEHSRFLFIPGPDDVGPSTALPRCPLPKYLTEEFQKYVPNAIFSSNPCRIKFYTQDIVLFRHDMLYRMRRSCLIPPSTEETSDPFEHIVLGDKSEQKAFRYTGVTCFNPGSFSNDGTFVAYRPCNQEVELSAL